MVRVIGHGTWLDKTALKVLEREKELGRKFEVVRTESGLGASGFPHVGSLGDAVRAYGIKLAIEELGQRSELIAFSDDMDGLRKVPAGLPDWLDKYLSFPVSSIPDPMGCHDSYGDHMSSLLRDAMDRCGIEYTFLSATQAYEDGTLTEKIEKILANAGRVGEIIREETGQEKYVEVLPYLPVCSECGRIYTTQAYKFLPRERKVLYVCKGAEIRGRWLEGCGHEGEADYTRGGGKLNWKAEFAARWDALKISFEAYGKDIADSVRVNDRVCEEILGYPPPYHVRYEMFLDKGGRKISKSRGNVFTPQVWLTYGSPQSLLLLLFKRIVGTRTLSVGDIPAYMTELDDLEDVYFGRKRVYNEMELAKLRGLYEYCHLLKPPHSPGVHAPYNLLVYLAKVAPRGGEVGFIVDKLREYSYLKNGPSEDLERRIRYARSWAEDFAEVEERVVKMSNREVEAVEDLIQLLQTEEDGEAIQASIFDIARKNGVKPRAFFRLLYSILIGVPEGPRLGPYIVAMGRKRALAAMERSLHAYGKA
ncbi:MAG: lysine--tRNA ligase [Candidatus Bathyarchaeia archaeon]